MDDAEKSMEAKSVIELNKLDKNKSGSTDASDKNEFHVNKSKEAEIKNVSA